MHPASAFRFPFARPKKRRAPEPPPAPAEHHFLKTQLALATADNSALRKRLADHRDATAAEIHALRRQTAALRRQTAALRARVAALAQQARHQQTRLDAAAQQHLLHSAALRADNHALTRRLDDAHQSKSIIKSAIAELTRELAALTALHASAKQQLTVVRREREAALDDACNIQNLLERERNHNQLKLYALHKEIIHLRKDNYFPNAAQIPYHTPINQSPKQPHENDESHTRHPDEPPLPSDSLSTQILTPPQESTKYHALFSPQIPMTPIRALHHSEYVVTGDGFSSIRSPAFAVVESGRPKLDFKMVLNEPFSAWGSAERPTMMYVGFEYPDGTSLCYLPIREVCVKYPPPRDPLDHPSREHALGADYGRDYVHLTLRELLYLALVEQARQVFSTRYSTENVELPRVSYEQCPNGASRLVSLTASMKPDARVETNIDGYTQNTLVSNELVDKRDDIVGDALLAMRFSKAYPNEAGYMLGFKLHGISVVTR